MEQPDYDPESTAPSPYLKGIVNARHNAMFFVHIFHSGLSAIKKMEQPDYDPEVQPRKRDTLKVGDLVEVVIMYNQNAREDQKSKHILLDYRLMEMHPTIRDVSSNSAGAVIHVIARFQKCDYKYSIFFNELFGQIHDNFKLVPESAAQSGRPLLLEISAKHLVHEKINGFVCIKFLSFADQGGLDRRVVKKPSSGLLMTFNGFSYAAWSPDYPNELKLSSRLISISDFVGRWFTFDSANQSEDCSLRVEGKVEIRDDVLPTRIKEYIVEVEMRCEASGEKNGRVLLKTEGGLAIDSDQLLKRPENRNLEFPQSWWFIPMLGQQYSLKLSPNNFEKKNLPLEEKGVPGIKYNGLIMDVMSDERCCVWCSEFDKDLLMHTKLENPKPLGKWIGFYQTRKENDRFRILDPKLIDNVVPTRINEKTQALEIFINCISQEEDDDRGKPVYYSEDFGFVSDFHKIIDVNRPLPFDAWVVLIKESKERCRFAISESNSHGTLLSPTKSETSCSSIRIPRKDSAPLDGRVTSPPGYIPKDKRAESSSSATIPTFPSLKSKFVDLMHLMPRNDDGGKYSSDEEDELGDAEPPRTFQMVSSSTASSAEDSDHELEPVVPPTTTFVQETRSVSFETSQYAGKSLKEISLLILEDPDLSRLIEDKNRRLYHAFANKVYNG